MGEAQSQQDAKDEVSPLKLVGLLNEIFLQIQIQMLTLLLNVQIVSQPAAQVLTISLN